jgi:hypothetical protein
VVAAGVVAEIGDMRRFENPRQLMAFLGLVLGEHSSGGKRKLTGITKASSVVARRLIVEAAWAYRMPAKIGQAMMLRQQSIATSPGRRKSDYAPDIAACWRGAKMRRSSSPPSRANSSASFGQTGSKLNLDPRLRNQ